MYDIVTLEPEDRVVKIAINSILKGEGAIPGPSTGFRLSVPGDTQVEGDGGKDNKVLVVVGHGSANSLSGCRTWSEYKNSVNGKVDWTADKTAVYIAACSTHGEGGMQFLHGNIAQEIKKDFPRATVWVSSSNVTAGTQSGDWHKL